jgi:peptidoglycan-N-acetylglucosamine deacetylase
LPDRVAYLTFDDGPSEWTADFLDLLAEKAVPATFFITARHLKGPAGLQGSYLDAHGATQRFGDLLKRALDQGHVLGNHSADHLDFATLSRAQLDCQLDENERLVNAALVAAGAEPRALTLVRPPFGSPWFSRSAASDPLREQARVGRSLQARGLNVLWNVDSGDSREWAQGESFSRVTAAMVPDEGAPSYQAKVARILASVVEDRNVIAGRGVVVLLHDTHNATRDALAALIDRLRALGYGFATIEDYVLWRWSQPSSGIIARAPLYEPSPAHGEECAVSAAAAGPRCEAWDAVPP